MVAAPEFVVRDVTSPDELNLCVRLYEEVFHLGVGDGSINTRLLVGIVRNSGIVVGAFEGPSMIGFALSFLAYDRDRAVHYHYSQLNVVAESAQGRGVGRRLKHAQRDASRAMDVHEMRWSFDPFLVRNAHFNLNVLGARAVSLERDLYGTYAHGLDVEATTDRLLAVWNLEDAPDVTTARGERAELVVPATWPRQLDSERRNERTVLLDTFDDLFVRGFVAVGCEASSPDVATYDFVRAVTS